MLFQRQLLLSASIVRPSQKLWRQDWISGNVGFSTKESAIISRQGASKTPTATIWGYIEHNQECTTAPIYFPCYHVRHHCVHPCFPWNGSSHHHNDPWIPAYQTYRSNSVIIMFSLGGLARLTVGIVIIIIYPPLEPLPDFPDFWKYRTQWIHS